MIRSTTSFIALLSLAGILVGCHDNDTSSPPTPSVPPAKAYPRLALPITDSLVCISDGHINLRVNPSANVVTKTLVEGESTAVTATYPGQGVSIYYTIRRVNLDEQQYAFENRLERISLNLNGTPARTDFTAPDCDTEGFIVTATSASLTPVQMLVAGDGYLVTATAFIDNAETAAAYDSIRPLIDMIYDDMARSIPNVKFVGQ